MEVRPSLMTRRNIWLFLASSRTRRVVFTVETEKQTGRLPVGAFGSEPTRWSFHWVVQRRCRDISIFIDRRETKGAELHGKHLKAWRCVQEPSESAALVFLWLGWKPAEKLYRSTFTGSLTPHGQLESNSSQLDEGGRQQGGRGREGGRGMEEGEEMEMERDLSGRHTLLPRGRLVSRAENTHGGLEM